MKKMYLLLTGLGLMASTFALQSCLDDDDDNYVICPTDYPNALVTVSPDTDNTAFFMHLDDSTTLWPVNMRQSPFGTKEVRALVNFRTPTKTELEKGGIYADMPCVFVNWIDSIRTKPTSANMNEKENLKQYGSNPVEIINDWVTIAEDGYLTLRFRTIWGRTGTIHRLNLVYRTDVNTPYYFTLYHDAQGDTIGQVGDALIAFKLPGELAETGQQDRELTLEWNSFSGKKTAKFKFRPKQVITNEQNLAGKFQKDIE
ncbi:MAG: NigD-like protein [Prevotella sp.]|nr:NigD-like protein [Prevotella sp.]